MNVMLLTIDAWRASHASFAPDGRPGLTPSLDGVAADSAVFTRAFGHGPATPYAFPSLFTSTLPLAYGGYERLSEERPLVSEAFARAGWRCIGVHGNPWLGEKYGYGRGYEAFRDVGEFGLPLVERGREVLLDRFGLDHPVYRASQRLYRHAQGPLSRLRGDAGDEVAVARSLVDRSDGDWFAWVHLLDPHAPYAPPTRHREAVGVPAFEGSATSLVTRAQHAPDALSEHERDVVRALYAASVRHADERAGTLLAAIDDASTLVVVTADHGEALFEHGQLGHEPALYDELLHVPLLVRPPGGTDGKRVVETPVRHVDVAPTLLDYAGVEAPPTFTGRSLRAAVDGDDPVELPVVAEVASTATAPGRLDHAALQVAVRFHDRKLIYDVDDAFGAADTADTVDTARFSGYDLEADPGEASPIPSPRGDAWRTHRAVLDRRLRALDFDEAASVVRDDEVVARLRDLGYVD